MMGPSDSFLFTSLEFWQPNVCTQVEDQENLAQQKRLTNMVGLEVYQLQGQVIADDPGWKVFSYKYAQSFRST